MIGRIVSPAMIEAATAVPSRLLVFMEVDHPDGWVRVHSGVGQRIHNGQIYYGAGEFLGMGNVRENAQASALRLNISLKIPDNSLLSEVLNGDPVGRDAFVHLVAFDEHRQLIDSTDYFVDAEIVDFDITRGNLEKGIKPSLSIVLSDFFERWNAAPMPERTTDEAQQHRHPGDKFFSLVEIIAGSSLDALPFKINPNIAIQNSGSVGGSNTWVPKKLN